MTNLKIAVDFDDTYTADPVLWDAFITNAITRGHTVYCVTYRHSHEGGPVRDTIGRLIGDANIVYTGRRAKREYCERQEIYINIWIDDIPDLILYGQHH